MTDGYYTSDLKVAHLALCVFRIELGRLQIRQRDQEEIEGLWLFSEEDVNVDAIGDCAGGLAQADDNAIPLRIIKYGRHVEMRSLHVENTKEAGRSGKRVRLVLNISNLSLFRRTRGTESGQLHYALIV